MFKLHNKDLSIPQNFVRMVQLHPSRLEPVSDSVSSTTMYAVHEFVAGKNPHLNLSGRLNSSRLDNSLSSTINVLLRSSAQITANIVPYINRALTWTSPVVQRKYGLLTPDSQFSYEGDTRNNERVYYHYVSTTFKEGRERAAARYLRMVWGILQRKGWVRLSYITTDQDRLHLYIPRGEPIWEIGFVLYLLSQEDYTQVLRTLSRLMRNRDE